MCKKTFIVIALLLNISAAVWGTESLPVDRGIQPLHAEYHKQITESSIRRGHTISLPGSYSISSSSVKIDSADTISTSVNVNTTPETRGIIAITSSNVVLDLNGSMLITDKSSLVAVVIADGINNITIKNGFIGRGSSNFDCAIVVGDTCSNIVLEDLTIQGCSHTDGAINFKGASTKTIKNSTLKNIDISNNTTDALAFTYCENITATNIKANNNTLTTAVPVILIENSNGIIIENSTITKNSSSASFYGIRASKDSNNLVFNNLKITDNVSTAGASASVVAGIYCDRNGGSADMEEINITNCTISRNRGSGSIGAQEAYGIYLSQVNFALIDNCLVRANSTKAATTTATVMHGAGLKLIECDFCTVKNSQFVNNRSGSFATVTNADSTGVLNINSTLNLGAGIINTGSGSGGTVINRCNSFLNCVCSGNGTQLAIPSASNVTYGPPTRYRYSNSAALAVGSVNQWAQNTVYQDCTFNHNGIAQHTDGNSWFVMGIGALNINTAKKTHYIRCTANNNNYFGFCDDGVLQSTPANSEAYFSGCLAVTNGTINSIAIGHVSADLKRNCRVYYTATVAGDVPPFLDLTFRSLITDLTNASSHVNISIRQV